MAVKSLVRGNIEHFWSIFTKISTFGQGWIQGWKTDGVIIDASAASMLRGRHVRWREGSSGRFIKRANYPEKQSGTSWQKIKPYFYGLL